MNRGPGVVRDIVKLTEVSRVVKVYLELACGHALTIFKSEYDRGNPARVLCKQCARLPASQESTCSECSTRAGVHTLQCSHYGTRHDPGPQCAADPARYHSR